MFSHDVTTVILVSQKTETAAMLVSKTNPLGVELFSYHDNTLFCSQIFAWLLATEWQRSLGVYRSEANIISIYQRTWSDSLCIVLFIIISHIQIEA